MFVFSSESYLFCCKSAGEMEYNKRLLSEFLSLQVCASAANSATLRHSVHVYMCTSQINSPESSVSIAENKNEEVGIQN